MPMPNNLFNFLTNRVSYPSQEEIVQPPINYRRTTISAVKDWRKNIWKTAKSQDEASKYEALKQLITTLNRLYNKEVTLSDNHQHPLFNCYNPEARTIYLSKPSIITTLHEYAHALFGTSEKKACRWSVQLFAKVWPKAFAQLEWDGHCLVRRAEARLAAAADNPAPTETPETA